MLHEASFKPKKYKKIKNKNKEKTTKIDNFKKSANFKKKSMDTFKIFDIKTKF
jgi:hypothetical protein